MAPHWKTTGTGRTVRQCVADFNNKRIDIPADTRVIHVDGQHWAVESVKLVGELSGDAYAAEHYFAFVPADAVKGGV
jgi:hypothetical protein